MAAKLTLSVDESLIDQAKALAGRSGRSLSSIVSEFLQSLIDRERGAKPDADTPVVSRISGILDLPEDYDHKADYRDQLLGKHG